MLGTWIPSLGPYTCKHSSVNLSVSLSGMIVGLVAITAPCANVEPYGAISLGAVAACVYHFGSWFNIKIKLDDPLDANAVHGYGG